MTEQISQSSPVQRQQERLHNLQQNMESVVTTRQQANDDGLLREDIIAEMREHLGAFARAAGRLAVLAKGEHSAKFSSIQESVETAFQISGEAGLDIETSDEAMRSAILGMSNINTEAATALIQLAAMAEQAEALQKHTSVLNTIQPLWALNTGIGMSTARIQYTAESTRQQAEAYEGKL